MSSINFDDSQPLASLVMVGGIHTIAPSSSSAQQQYGSSSNIVGTNKFDHQKGGIKIWSGGILNDGNCGKYPLMNRMQSIVIKEDVKEKVITSVHISEKIIHILVDYELKQIIQSNKPNVSIVCYHIYLKKKNKISILIYCSDKNIYLFDILKREKKRKSKKQTTTKQREIPSFFTRVPKSSDINPIELDWKNEFANSYGIIIKELNDGDILKNVSNLEAISQIQTVESETLKSLINDESKKSSGKHVLLLTENQVFKMYQEEDAEDLTVSEHTSLPSKTTCRLNILYYCEEKSNAFTFDQNSYIVDDDLFKCLFGRDFVFLTSSVCLTGCEDGSIFAFPSNNGVIERFSNSSCHRIITKLRDPVQNIIPLIISPDPLQKRYNSLLLIGQLGHIVLLYHDTERVQYHSWYVDQHVTSSLVHKEILLFTNQEGSVFSLNIFSKTTLGENPFSLSKGSRQVNISDQIDLREIPSTSDIILLHEMKSIKFHQNSNINLDVSLSQLSFGTETKTPNLAKPKGTCTIITREGWLRHIEIPSHSMIDEQLSKSVRLNRLQTGVRDMIVKLDHCQNQLSTLRTTEVELNKEIYSLNIAMHLLHEWNEQGKEIKCEIYCKPSTESFQSILDCSITNGTRFTLTNQWSVIIILEQAKSSSKCFSYPILYLENGKVWNRTLSLNSSLIENLHSPFIVTVLISFSHAESQFSLQVKRQEFNLMDLVQPTSPQFVLMKKNLPSLTLEHPKQRLSSLVNSFHKKQDGETPNFSHLTSLMSPMTHAFKLRFNPLEEEFVNNWQSILQIPTELSHSSNFSLRNIPQGKSDMSPNNFATACTLTTPLGNDLKLRISHSIQNTQSFDLLLQGGDFNSLLSARLAILKKFNHFLQVRSQIVETDYHKRLPPKEELVDLIKVMQNLGDHVQNLSNSLEEVEHSVQSLFNKHDRKKTNSEGGAELVSFKDNHTLANHQEEAVLSQVVAKVVSFDKAMIELFREIRQTKCGL